jgi:hypothetical protein
VSAVTLTVTEIAVSGLLQLQLSSFELPAPIDAPASTNVEVEDGG